MERIGIIGLGLIGGSMGLALKRARGDSLEIVGYSRSPRTMATAYQRGAVDRAAHDLASAVHGCQIVILATPVMTMKQVLEELAAILPSGSVVTDTASTKGQVMAWAECLPPGVSFIGGHPMAGKETSGIGAADPDLFQGCTYCLTPASGVTAEATGLVLKLVEAIGAKPLFIDAARHDELVAGVSHLPLLLSYALVSATTQSPAWREMAALAATGYRDLSRLASGHPDMARDICLTNRDNILRWLDRYVEELIRYRGLVAAGHANLEVAFRKARQAREQWLKMKQAPQKT